MGLSQAKGLTGRIKPTSSCASRSAVSVGVSSLVPALREGDLTSVVAHLIERRVRTNCALAVSSKSATRRRNVG
jgi:hypothetical protein